MTAVATTWRCRRSAALHLANVLTWPREAFENEGSSFFLPSFLGPMLAVRAHRAVT